MANIRLTIQSNNVLYEPPIEEGIQLEWERFGTPGKLTFTVLKVDGLVFNEGDQVCFYYNDKLVFVGYVFSKKRDKEHHIKVTCYDQLRYLKNKYTYVFEKKTATQIVTALCNDFGLQLGGMDNTAYVIPAIAEENKSALDIILDVLEETLLNTGNMFVLYDEGGKIRISDVANMMSPTLIYEDSAENFDYSSSIDDETYNSVVLYYKGENEQIQVYTANSPSRIKQWGLLRYFEEVDTPAIAQNKANALLKLYSKKTRELKVSGAFGDISVRGGTLIPVKLYLGDIEANNFMLVEKVTHKFDKDHHTMDLTLEGNWEDSAQDIVSSSSGETETKVEAPKPQTGGKNTKKVLLEVNSIGIKNSGNSFTIKYKRDGKTIGQAVVNSSAKVECDINTQATITISPSNDCAFTTRVVCGDTWAESKKKLCALMSEPVCVTINWYNIKGGGSSVHTSSSGKLHGGAHGTFGTAHGGTSGKF